MVQSAAFAQRDADERLLGFFRRLADRFRHFPGFAVAKANAALLIANNDERGEREVLTTLHDLSDAVDGDELVDQFTFSAFFLSTAIAVVTARATTIVAARATATAATRTTAAAGAATTRSTCAARRALI